MTTRHAAVGLVAEVLGEQRKGAEDTLAGGQRLHAVAEEGNHGKTSVLDLGLLQSEGLVVVPGRQSQGIEDAARIATADGVQFSVTVDLCATHQDRLDPDELRDREGQREAEVLSAIELDLAGIDPGDTGCALGDNAAQARKHGPAAVNELALAEAVDAEHFVVWLQPVLGRELVWTADEVADDVASLVHGCVLVELIEIDLQELGGLAKAEGIEAAVTGQGSIKPCRALGVGEPEGVAGVLTVASTTLAGASAKGWRRCRLLEHRASLLGGLLGGLGRRRRLDGLLHLLGAEARHVELGNDVDWHLGDRCVRSAETGIWWMRMELVAFCLSFDMYR
eukprot:TRINITY_DN3086_c0_g1_i1.p2 TRINITY_DN3086_c0_g1~~TRINITY_DN3086_c0_g1_i1.p2  ORF type:complete len:337 (+),score=53.69 TRINITY_DN3086_c0_g1_i1:301-1311(+)